MKLSTRGRYAVMAMVDISKWESLGPVSIPEISQRQQIALNYLEQLLNRLRRASLVQSIRGAKGGYKLALPSDKISIACIVKAVDEDLVATRCTKSGSEGCLKNSVRCQTHNLWAQLTKHVLIFLEKTRLIDVLNDDLIYSSLIIDEGTLNEQKQKPLLYFDYNATAPLHKTAQVTLNELMASPLNPSATHSYGQKAKSILMRTRRALAAKIHVNEEQIIFTGGGTEANNQALRAVPDAAVFVQETAHDSAYKACANATYFSVLQNGQPDLNDLAEKLKRTSLTKIVSVLYGHNETGQLLTLEPLHALCKRHGAFLHVDATQALEKYQ